jgi:hypothetical protein
MYHPTGTYQEGKDPESIDAARLKFVPKDFRKTRSICMEPLILMWAQQGVRDWVENSIGHGVLRSFVFLKDQTKNQEGAQFGSDFGLVDTIDLSSASDSVGWRLIKATFPAKVLKYLAGTRSKCVVVPDQDDPIEVLKFAPMGSALCFPVQTILYSSIVIMATLRDAFSSDEWTDWDSSSTDTRRGLITRLFHKEFSFSASKYQPFRVYGDDIICDSRVTSNVMALLSDLKFMLNEEKSFVGQHLYRESCGKHYYDGSDVTPFAFRIKKLEAKVRIDTLAGVITSINRSLEYGYRNLGRCLKNFALYHPVLNSRQDSLGRNQVLFSDGSAETPLAILCKTPRNDHLRKRLYHADAPEDTRLWYQRDEVRSLTNVTLDDDRDHDFDNYHYIKWQRSHRTVGKDADIQSAHGSGDAHGMRVQWRWTPL